MKSKSKQKVIQELKEIVLPSLKNNDKVSKALIDSFPEYKSFYISEQDATTKIYKVDNKKNGVNTFNVATFPNFPIFFIPQMEAKFEKYENPKIKQQNNDVDDPDGAKEALLSYYMSIRQKVRYAFGMQKMEQLLEDIINNIDQPTDQYKLVIPRYRKLQRLRMFNNHIVSFFLQLLHNYYWVDLAAGVTSLENINTIIKRITPIVHNLHQTLLNELHYEFPKDLNEESIYY